MTLGQRPVSVVIPAHDESARIGRLLGQLTAGSPAGAVELVVACNGCTDDTAAIARTFDGVTVVEIPEASKRLALQAGDAIARHGVRAYLDADVTVTRHDLLSMVDALGDGVLAAGPVGPGEPQTWPLVISW